MKSLIDLRACTIIGSITILLVLKQFDTVVAQQNSCMSDVQCQPGYQCSGGICLIQEIGLNGQPLCQSNMNCPAGLICYQGNCMPQDAQQRMMFQNGQLQQQMYPNGQLPMFPNGQQQMFLNGQRPMYPNGQLPMYPNGQPQMYPNGQPQMMNPYQIGNNGQTIPCQSSLSCAPGSFCSAGFCMNVGSMMQQQQQMQGFQQQGQGQMFSQQLQQLGPNTLVVPDQVVIVEQSCVTMLDCPDLSAQCINGICTNVIG